ncbi:MAG: thioredoxin domain-containing protein [Candidatus Promineifilaceae bacterium]
MANKLAAESSPYLLQHAGNPVEWYPWGEEALQRARAEDKPILLSIGYAACHWCHVMAHESFEDPRTAALMNEHFINIKVDREERPDLDNIYMSAVQALTGQGGWPMTVFLTPDGAPFYGGTYFPPTPRYGMPSFTQLLNSVITAWRSQREEIEKSAGSIRAHLQGARASSEAATVPGEALLDQALEGIVRAFDSEQGGFSGAPKFPPSMTIEFLLRMAAGRDDHKALHMAELTLTKMAHGGMYDQLGGGFARYSTDAYWLVPHFEKMLYDNALLARAYLHAYQLTGKVLYRRVVEETLDFVVRDMRHAGGGFYSSYDADSEGEEGKFYVWQAEEIRRVLQNDADLFMARYGVSAGGNWEGKNILHVVQEIPAIAERFHSDESSVIERLQLARDKLLIVRDGRPWPGLDDKVLTAWNGLMLAAFAEAGLILDRPDYLQVAAKNAEFLFNTMRREDGRLLRTWNAGSEAKYNAYLEDYAYLADGLLALYQATFDPQWFTWAAELAGQMVTHFRDASGGGFFDTSNDHESLLFRPKEVQDNATPSGNSVAAQVLQKLSLYTGNGAYWDIAEDSVNRLAGFMARFPTGFANWLCAASFALGNPAEVAIVGDPDATQTKALIRVVAAEFRPYLVVAAGPSSNSIPLLADRDMIGGKPTAYLCRRFVCRTPVTEPAALAAQLS